MGEEILIDTNIAIYLLEGNKAVTGYFKRNSLA